MFISVYILSHSKSNNSFHGDIAVLINDDLVHKYIQLDISLQTVTVQVSCLKSVTVFSLYLPPYLKCIKADIVQLLSQPFAMSVPVIKSVNASIIMTCCSEQKIQATLRDTETEDIVEPEQYLQPVMGN